MAVLDTALQISFLSTRMELYQNIIHEMFKPVLCRYNAKSQMALYIFLRIRDTWQKHVYFFRPKKWLK